MSYTNMDLVRHHLVAAWPAQDRVCNQLLSVTDDYVTFFNGPVDRSTVVVKSVQGTGPMRASVTLADDRTSLAVAPLVPGTVLVASDTSLGTVYIENVDYAIDYNAAELALKTGGALGPGQPVTVWFQPYHLYREGLDYLLDAASARLKRLAAGGIAVGEIVHVDYTPIYQSFNEELVAQAVTEANALVGREIDPDDRFGADAVLQAAATSRAIEIVCRASAARTLSRSGDDDRAALAWMKLAEAYAQRSDMLLQSFRPPFEGPMVPQHS